MFFSPWQDFCKQITFNFSSRPSRGRTGFWAAVGESLEGRNMDHILIPFKHQQHIHVHCLQMDYSKGHCRQTWVLHWLYRWWSARLTTLLDPCHGKWLLQVGMGKRHYRVGSNSFSFLQAFKTRPQLSRTTSRLNVNTTACRTSTIYCHTFVCLKVLSRPSDQK